MAENLIEDVVEPQLQEIVTWLRENYEGIARACEAQGLPKPPPWRDVPVP